MGLPRSKAQQFLPSTQSPRHATRRGFTLFEVLIVIVIIGIASAMGIAGFGLFMKKVTAKADAHRLRDAMQLARSDAVTRSRNSGVAVDSTLQWFRFVDHPSDGIQGSYDSKDTLVSRDSLKGFQMESISCPRMKAGLCSIVYGPDGATLGAGSMRLQARHAKAAVMLDVLVIAATGFAITEVR